MTLINQLVLVPPGLPGLEPGVHRVIATAPPLKLVALARLAENRAEHANELAPKRLLKPVLANLDLLQRSITESNVSVIPEASTRHITNDLKSPRRESAKFLKRHGILQALIEPDVLFRMLFAGHWSHEVVRAATDHHVSPHTVLRLLQRYFLLRMDLDLACMDAQRASGQARRVVKKLGRRSLPTKAGKPQAVGRNMTQKDLDLIELFYDAREDKKVSVASMWRDYEQNFSPRSAMFTADGHLELRPNPLQSFITEAQFRYGLSKVTGRLRLATEQAGQRRVDLSNRVAIGSARDGIPYPGHTYIVDATVADVYLVSAFDLRILIGRPVIYIVIDAFSSLIVGVHVALEGPNFEQARIAMFRAMCDKGAWLDWLGVPGLAGMLPQGCRPTFWLADRGELHSHASRNVQLNLETNLSVAAAYRADWKSIVERNFGILNELCIHWLPGAVKERVRERGSPDHRLDAVLTLKTFTRIILRICAQLNLTRDMSRHLSASFMRKDVLANPLGFWHHGIDFLHGSAVFLDTDSLRSAVLASVDATLNRHGLFWDKYRFTADWMKDHELVRATGFNGACTVPLIRCPDVPNRGFVLLPRESTQREVHLHSTFSYLDRFAIEDVQEMLAHRELAAHDQAVLTRGVRLALGEANARDIKESIGSARLANSADPLSNRAKTSYLKAARKAEVERQAQPSQAAPSATPARAAEQGIARSPQTSPDISIPASPASEYDSDLGAAFSNWGSQ